MGKVCITGALYEGEEEECTENQPSVFHTGSFPLHSGGKAQSNDLSVLLGALSASSQAAQRNQAAYSEWSSTAAATAPLEERDHGITALKHLLEEDANLNAERLRNLLASYSGTINSSIVERSTGDERQAQAPCAFHSPGSIVPDDASVQVSSTVLQQIEAEERKAHEDSARLTLTKPSITPPGKQLQFQHQAEQSASFHRPGAKEETHGSANVSIDTPAAADHTNPQLVPKHASSRRDTSRNEDSVDSIFHATQSALDYERVVCERAQELRQNSYTLTKERKQQLRAVAHPFVKLSSSEESIRDVSNTIINSLTQLSDRQMQNSALQLLCNMLKNQCASNVGNWPSLALAQAYVCASVIERTGLNFIDLLIATLTEYTPLAVPKTFKNWGSALDDDSLDEACTYVRLLGCLVHVGAPMPETHFAWAFIARLLNGLPPCRVTASVLEVFLHSCGHALCREYGHDVVDALMQCIRNQFIPEMAKLDEDNVGIRYKLDALVAEQKYTNPPQLRQ